MRPSSTHKDLAVYHFKTKHDFESWIRDNWSQTESIWIMFAKKSTPAVSVSYVDAREVAICYGWIDGLINKYDDHYYLIKFSKRRVASTWSKINRDIATGLINAGAMKESGIAEVERAKADGRWAAAYDSPSAMTVPDWFIRDIKQNPKAYAFFKTLNKANLYSIGYHLHTAKSEVTRQRRAQKYITMFENNQPIH